MTIYSSRQNKEVVVELKSILKKDNSLKLLFISAYVVVGIFIGAFLIITLSIVNNHKPMYAFLPPTPNRITISAQENERLNQYFSFLKLKNDNLKQEMILQSINSTTDDFSKPPISKFEKPAKAYEVLPVYFATDRNYNANSTPSNRFGGDRGKLVYGECDVSIPATHHLGNLESPSWLKFEFNEDVKKHITVMSILNIDDEEIYFGEIKQSLGDDPTNSALIFIHGYNVSFYDAARRTAQLAYDLNFVGPSIFYSWPSDSKIDGYFHDEQNIEWSEPNIQKFIVDVVKRTNPINLYIIAHSMGNRALTNAIIEIERDNPEILGKIRNIILTAPDIDADVFKNNIAPKIVTGKIPVTLYASSNDKALKLSKKIHAYSRAGDSKPDMMIYSGIESIDASNVETDFIGHSYYAESKSVLSDIFDIIKNGSKANARFGLESLAGKNGKYWKFKN